MKPKLTQQGLRGTRGHKKGVRAALLEAATYLFGHYGYEGVTTRMIVTRAGVNISTLHYYYKSKQDLYDAVIHSISEFINRNVAKRLLELRMLHKATQIEKKDLLLALIALMRTLAQKLITKKPLNFGLIIVREQILPSQGFDILFKESMQPIHHAIARLIASLTDRDPDDARVILESHALLGQVLGFIVTRTVVLRITGYRSYGTVLTQHICEVIEDNILKLYGNY